MALDPWVLPVEAHPNFWPPRFPNYPKRHVFKSIGRRRWSCHWRRLLMEHVRTRAGAYLGSSAPPLAIAAAITAAVVRVHRLPGRVRRLQELARRFSNALPSRPEILNDPRTPVTAIHPRDAAQAQRLTEALTQAGFVPPWIRYPGGPGNGFFALPSKRPILEVKWIGCRG